MEMEEFLRQSEALMNSAEMQTFWRCISQAAGFHLTDREREPFQKFHKFMTEPQPRFVSELRADMKKERWYHLLVNGILGNVQNSFACGRYHQDRVAAIESSALACFEVSGVRERIGNSTVGGGNTLALDFEYQAYVLAYRRCLDQFARALAAYFKNDYNSFRRLPNLLAKVKPETVAQALSVVVTKYSTKFDFVLSEAGERSVRDRIAHYEFVPAGVMNISARGFILAGGGENLGSSSGGSAKMLQDVLAERTRDLFMCITELVHVFVTEVGRQEAAVYR